MRNMLSLFACSLLGVATIVGCENEPKPNDNKPTAIITFERSEVLSIEGEAAPVVAYFTIENRADGVTPTAECDAEWVSELEVVASVVKFKVTANEERLPRETTITLRCGDAEADLRLVQNELTRRYEVFQMLSEDAVPYRIPAATVTNDGTMLLVADYRHCRSDIGVIYNGRIDLHIRRSTDNGLTWDATQTIIEGKGELSPDFMNVGYGDPCIVADADSRRVLLMSCAGNVSYHNGTRNNHQNIARFYSEDGGMTWSEPTDIAESIYSQFDKCSYGPVNAMFVASGRIMQSKTVKVGEYHRLYCAVLVRDRNSLARNFVLYSDDFGGNWTVLGGVDVTPIVRTCDEPKVEELPDGSVLLSSRYTGGRYFNVYHYTNVATAEGEWGSSAYSNSNNAGIVARDNATNGEVMVVPAVRYSDGEEVDLLLQSVPMGPGRKNVGIYYKALSSPSDYATAGDIAANWEGSYQATKLGSAYSTMAWQADNRLGFFWEETTYCSDAVGYTLVYDCYSIEKITNGKYRYRAE